MHDLIQADEWFISSDCPEALSAIPVLRHDELKREDVEKTDEMSDDVADDLRYGLKTMLSAKAKPFSVMIAEKVQTAHREHGPTAANIVHLQEMAKRKGKPRFGQQYY